MLRNPTPPIDVGKCNRYKEGLSDTNLKVTVSAGISPNRIGV